MVLGLRDLFKCMWNASHITNRLPKAGNLVHLTDEVVDLLIPAASLTALDVVQALLGEAAQRSRELEGPQEVGGLLEGGAGGDDLVDEILDTDDVVLAQDLSRMRANPMLECSSALDFMQLGCKMNAPTALQSLVHQPYSYAKGTA